MEKQRKKELVGKVVSTKNSKTITILVESYRKHPLYSKRFKVSRKFAVHDEKEQAKKGDIITVIETRPLSSTKRFRLKSIDSIVQEGAK